MSIVALSKEPSDAVEPLHPRIPLGHAGVDACLKGGLLKGALHEVFAGDAGAEAAASAFAMALGFRAGEAKTLLWIRQDFSALEFGELSATGFLELGLDPSRVLLLRVGDVTSALRAAGDALTCAALGAVIIEIPGPQKKLDLVTSRRLTLAAQKKGVSAVLLRFMAEPDASAAETRWSIAPLPSSAKKEDWAKEDWAKEDWGYPAFSAALVRNRHGATGEWVMEWNCDERRFGAADRGAVVSASADGPPAKAWTAA
jgi:protein ImuA